MSDDDIVERVRPDLDAFERAAEQYAVGNEHDGFDVIKTRILNGEPSSDGEGQLARAWGMISVGMLVLGTILHQLSGISPDALSEDTFYFVQLVTGDGQPASLDDEMDPESATAVRLMIAGANSDLDTGSALVSATWEHSGPAGILLVLENLVTLYADMALPEPTP